jgi:hypothetical protein
MSSDLQAIGIGGTFGEMSTTNSTVSDALSTIIIMFPFLVYGLFILRKVQPLNHSTPVECHNGFNQTDGDT